MTRAALIALTIVHVIPAHAHIYSYTCRLDGKSLVVKVDDVRNTLQWRGKNYRIKIQEDCAKFGWRAERAGEAFNFCTATKGYADFEEGGVQIQCDLDR